MRLAPTFRSLLHSPAHTLALLLVLTLGLAGASAIHALVYRILLAPLPYADAGQLVSLELRLASGESANPPALFEVYRELQSLAAVGFYRSGGANLRADDAAPAEHLPATRITASLIPLLGVTPLLGRTFTAEEELQGGPGAVILSEAEWRSRYDADPQVLGRTLLINEVPRQVVGVMPATFAFPDVHTRIWLPARPSSGGVVGDFSYAGVARLAPGVRPQAAQKELQSALLRLAEDYPRLQSGAATQTWLDAERPAPVVTALQTRLTAALAPMLWALAAAAGLLLLAAWANGANLMLIRADQQSLELAVRAALGASRARIAGHFLAEALILGGLAGALALLLAQAAVSMLLALGPTEIPRLAELRIGPATLICTALLIMLSVALLAAVPALRQRAPGLAGALRDGGRGASAGAARQRLRALITGAQIAIALAVVAAALVLLRSAERLYAVHPGYVATGVVSARTLLPFARHDDASTVAFYQRLSERAAALPGVDAVGLALHVPLSPGSALTQRFRVELGAEEQELPVQVADAGYFQTLQIPLLAGRSFAPLSQQASTELILSESAARTLLGSRTPADAVGRWLPAAAPGPRYRVIGVVADVREWDLATPPVATVYRPQAVPGDAAREPGAQHALSLLLRSEVPLDTLLPALRQIVSELDPSVPLHQVETLETVMRASTARLSLLVVLMGAAALLTLVLGMIGLYGVMASVVALRNREFGIRLALGAEPRALAARVAAGGLRLTLGGMLGGLALYALATPLLRAFVYDIPLHDPATLCAAAALLLCVALLACWLPARRAAQVDPAVALGAD